MLKKYFIVVILFNWSIYLIFIFINIYPKNIIYLYEKEENKNLIF